MGISSEQRPTGRSTCRPGKNAASVQRQTDPRQPENITIHLDEHIRSVQGKECYEDEMFSIRYFKKGSAHITFRKPELVDRLNDIIARHYPEMLPSQ